MLSFYSAWISSRIFLALAFASGGPIYFAEFVPATFGPYEALVHAVHTTERLMSAHVESLLLNGS
jgi:hypothetical protein